MSIVASSLLLFTMLGSLTATLGKVSAMLGNGAVIVMRRMSFLMLGHTIFPPILCCAAGAFWRRRQSLHRMWEAPP